MTERIRQRSMDPHAMGVAAIPRDAIITIAGTVGIGKSTLTAALAERLGFRTSFENVEENPYLERFYAERVITRL